MLVIRADASTAIGTGHVLRTLALAQAWLEQVGKVVFASAELPAALQRRLTNEGMLTHRLDGAPGSNRDAAKTLELADRYHAQWVVADGYRLTRQYRESLCANGLKVLRVDDLGDGGRRDATLLLNQNLDAAADLYPGWDDAGRLLLGPQYALVRRELLDGAQNQRAPNERAPNVRRQARIASRILVTLGGSDPDNQTLKVVQALQAVRSDDLQAAVLIGAGNPHADSLRQAVAEDDRIQLHFDVQNMATLLCWADMAIAAGGGSAWERALFGLPSLVMILAENQVAVAEPLDRNGWSTNLGWASRLTTAQLTDAIRDLLNDPQRRELQSQRSQQGVDGKGASWTVAAMRQWRDA